MGSTTHAGDRRAARGTSRWAGAAALVLALALGSGCASAGRAAAGPGGPAAGAAPSQPTATGAARSRPGTAGAAPALPAAARVPAATAGEVRAERYLESVRDRPGLALAFLREMPKGGDLHNHLSGAVYAESFLRWAAEDSLCIALAALTATSPPCHPAADTVPAAAALRDAGLYGRLIDAWSMRNWSPARVNGHDQFFDTFGRFGRAGAGHTGDMIAETATRAAEDHVAYLELMLTPDQGIAARAGAMAGWDDSLPRLREKLLPDIRRAVGAARQALDAAETRERKDLGCGPAAPDPGCDVAIRYLYQVLRAQAPERVFAQILTGFELARADPRVVGLNLVQPEDDRIAMRDYTLHMRMIGWLHRLDPEVNVSLHAGELAPGLVPPEGLRFHIRQAVEVAGARRIGHGVDILSEDHPFELLREMAAKDVLVEINLTSNAVILGVAGAAHPLATYLAYGVPVALSTDDEGVSRSDMSHEYLRAVEEQGLDYPTLKRMARSSLEHGFVEGASLWKDRRAFRPIAACAGAPGAGSQATGAPGAVVASAPGPACEAVLRTSEKARLEWALEQAFARFEQSVPEVGQAGAGVSGG